MIQILFFLIAVLFAPLISIAGEIGDQRTCEIIKKTKTFTAFLIDSKGNVSTGPIDFGSIAVPRNYLTDQLLIPTGYRLIVTPKRLKYIGTCPAGGCISLKKVKPRCANSQEYEISLGFSFKRENSVRPYRYLASEKREFIAWDFTDPKNENAFDAEVKFEFDMSIVGEITEKAN